VLYARILVKLAEVLGIDREVVLISLHDFARSPRVAEEATMLSEMLLRPSVTVRRYYQVDWGEIYPIARRYVEKFTSIRGPRMREIHPYFGGVPYLNNVATVPIVDLLGIYGAGVATDGDSEFPAIFCDEDVYGPGQVPFDELVDANELVRTIVGEEIPESAVFMGMPAPEPHFGPADGAKSSGNFGTLGTLVTTNQGTLGILTAGHVAPILTARVHSNGEQVGSVVYTASPLTSAPGVACDDVAVVEIDPAALPSATSFSASVAPPITMSRVVAANSGQRLVRYSTRGQQADGILAKAPWLDSPNLVGMWRDVYMTFGPISIQGDSGAPVLVEGTNEIVGHVVGGSPGFSSYIQDINTQLTASQSIWRAIP